MKELSKTIKELAKELDVSNQYIQKVIHQLPKSKQPQKTNGVFKITSNVEAAIREYMATSHRKKTTKQPNNLSSSVVRLQQRYIDKLEQQLDEKDRQISKLQEQNIENQKLIDQEQQLHLADQERIKEIEQPEKQNKPTSKETREETIDNQQQDQPKKGFFKRLFGNK